ncbi:ig-like domain-containing protein : Uncharacterized protein OS=Chthoniobacter flavus Ellin428 GN=CfE428DRAFT_6209 PE=4 SV=1: PSCyt1: PSCyt2: PSD1 [Gemmata massiliana]|uniref:Cytochrome c domain-containing protein n=2 Tax=Gemmata massiliana TaxID=1210884 RepID=A0A6P2CZS2_9BACT|nr:ig-like domain-containing protein : Uncharacterized protein OS=Chthoniobacter flavus Ellin428 GN=CfE428DRAFT_6209 PE=4 SV=1: PSCyt1: PSCyt2: PSD1 [Gemmata massiliana]
MRLVLFIPCFLLTSSLVRAGGPPTVTPDVQAILDLHCVKCHGPLDQKAGLRLDTAEAIGKGSDDGAVVVAGKPDESKLIRVLAAKAETHMPPKKQLPDADIAKLRAWVTTLATPPSPKPQPVPTQARVPSEPVAAIDYFLDAGWQARRVTPARVCDDRTFVRRATLDLIGRIPTPEEVNAFLFDAAPNKREALVDRLLVSDEAARNWREVWDAILLGRGRREDRRRDGGWFTFLEDAYKRNRPWNELVRAIIDARPEEKGAAWFLFEKRNDYQQIAEAVAPVIYGARVDCAQCHDHPLAGEIKQGHYWGLVAAFNRGKNVQRGAPAVRESATGGFMNFTNLKKESQPAVIALLTGKVIDEPRPAVTEDAPDLYVDPAAAVPVPKFSRRMALAAAATSDNPLLARSFVNHTWAVLLGRGIVDPPDEMNSKHPPSHPELLDWLAADFASHKYDVRRLIRSIVLSRGYQLAAWTGPNAPAPDAFAAALERSLTAEAISRSARVTAGRAPDDDTLRRAVIEAFPGLPTRPAQATLQQALFLANSDLLTALFKPGPGDAAPLPALPEQVRAAFRRALVRDPDAEELARGVAFLRAHADPRAAAGQLLWALVTGPEFLTNH